MTAGIIVGLSGERQVGKSIIANYLVDTFGFERAHPFNGGKAATRAYFEYIGVPAEEAHRMTDGDLKDVPSAYLPNNAKPRFFMEEFGHFMGVGLGPDWTIGKELERIESAAAKEGREARIIMESIVYEIDYLRARNEVMVVEVRRDGADKTIEAPRTSAAGKLITPDMVIDNNGTDFVELYRRIDEEMFDRFGIEREPCLQPDF
ncbi:MAG: hypothetical protein ABJN42_20950 [Roseibium sp.]|uniref:hypothetical protein n=1 Tax=Roseibium sp. TaxID=1936156 RepID=UPI0032985AC6